MAKNTHSEFSGRWTLITGGASGIGYACAQHLADLGSHLVLLDMDSTKLDQAVHSLAAKGIQAIGYSVDITNTQALENVQVALQEQGIPIRHLITAAGVLQPMHDINTLDQAVHDRVWDVNYHGTYHSCRIWGQAIAQANGGSMVTVSSITAMRPTPLLAYGPAKAALGALTSSLAVNYAPKNIRINAVAPGFTLTEALQEKFDSGQRDPSSIVDTIPMRRLAEPLEIAQAVAFLLSDQASAITGITLPVDCGWLAGASWATYQPLP
ncbi:SDR family oxidoreductase [Alcaligenaceae bacterium]|nr:SDR family oxidoreductase [Alcaligenaceae bacterium]